MYLITYIQADTTQFTRERFANVVVSYFEDGATTKVLRWVCSLEPHQISGEHFHLAIKLDKVRRWFAIKRRLSNEWGIEVNFSGSHDNYYSAWKYVTKTDKNFVQSNDHPDLNAATAPRTGAATSKKRKNCNSKNAPKPKKSKLDNFTISETILNKNIKTPNELMALANAQKQNGKTDLAEFILDKGIKKISDLLETTWAMNNATNLMVRQQKTRFQILTDSMNSECDETCDGRWLTKCLDTLDKNNIVQNDFSDALFNLINFGRSKYRNLMLIGPANCGKTFLIKPLQKIYNCFQNPASSSFAWVGAEEAEFIILNDFRWSSKLIPWHDFLLLLEGEPVHLPAPKSHFSKDILLEKDTPIVCTSSEQIVHVKNGIVSQRETQMMSVRWKVFEFHYQIPEENQVEIPPCPVCFGRLVYRRY